MFVFYPFHYTQQNNKNTIQINNTNKIKRQNKQNVLRV
ncbi:hypothetical protein A6M57_8900 [Staphylococcus pseudintermedius]|nr:hypothetical protein A6M57_8900 [Staphylococcus pseudintermedius]